MSEKFVQETGKTVSNFVKEVVARLKGDDAEVLALKNERKATSNLKGQISALEAKVVDDEDKLSEAEEGLKNALYPTTLITSASDYIREIKRAQELVDATKANLDATKESIKFFKAILTEKF